MDTFAYIKPSLPSKISHHIQDHNTHLKTHSIHSCRALSLTITPKHIQPAILAFVPHQGEEAGI